MATQTAPSITCQKCGGTGRHPLNEDMFETLCVVRKLRRVCAGDVKARLGWLHSVTAINNRLEELRALGFLSRIRSGKFYFYSPVATKPTPLQLRQSRP